MKPTHALMVIVATALSACSNQQLCDGTHSRIPAALANGAVSQKSLTGAISLAIVAFETIFSC